MTMNRRFFLKAAAGAALSTHVRPAPAFPAARGKVKGVVWLWMKAGMCPGHTWDPKPKNAAACGIPSIATSVPGIEISAKLPLCAAQMKHLSIIRTVTHGFGDLSLATELMHLGEVSPMTSDVLPIGTILAHELGVKDFPLPKYVSIDGPAVPERPFFGQDCMPVRVNGDNPANPVPNLRRTVDAARDRARSELLADQNREWDSLRQQSAVDQLVHAAASSQGMMNTPLLRTFNLDDEPSSLRLEYGPGFGQHCLLARRLVEAGCPFVEIGQEGWGGMSCCLDHGLPQAKALDAGLGTLVKDLAQRGALADILVVCAAPFSKSPRPAANGAWSSSFSVVLAGGFLSGGLVVGETDPNGIVPKPRISVKDLFATIYCAAGLNGETSYRTASRNRTYGLGGSPIEELFF